MVDRGFGIWVEVKLPLGRTFFPDIFPDISLRFDWPTVRIWWLFFFPPNKDAELSATEDPDGNILLERTYR